MLVEELQGTGEADGASTLVLAFCCVLTVLLSGMYCGLTIGIMGINTMTLEIIRDAGPSPDCIYASEILPLRRRGHQLLVTLLLGNMLTLVLTSQIVARMITASGLVKFAVSTLLILVFGEIIPMSICSNGKYALFLGAQSIPLLRLSLFLLYPVARPLGKFLDYMVAHEVGQLYDREELKKLIKIHSERFAMHTGMGDEESRMILSALELKETLVKEIMTPLHRVRMVESTEEIDLGKIWDWGKSRIPVYSSSKANVIGVLYIKSLIGTFQKYSAKEYLVHDCLQASPSEIALINENMSLVQALEAFERKNIQLFLVTKDSLPSKEFECPHGLLNHESSSDYRFGPKKGTGYQFLSRECLLEQNISLNITGIVTLEDIIEKLIFSEIYDEDEVEIRNSCEVRTSNSMSQPNTALHPRVSFSSYGVPDRFGEEPNCLTDDQLYVLAQYFSRSYVFFAVWDVNHIIQLLREVKDQVVYPEAGVSSAILYTSNVPTECFCFLLSGSITVNYNISIQTNITSFSSLGDEVLNHGRMFIPQFTATVASPSRFIQISLSNIRSLQACINKIRFLNHQKCVRLLPLDEQEELVVKKENGNYPFNVKR